MELILLGIIGIMYLSKTNSTAKMNPVQPYSRPSVYQPAQPSQVYPFTPIAPPRVDNKNQPWYNNARSFMAGPGDTAGGIAGNVSSVVKSLGDVWGNLNDYFGGNDSKSNLVSTDDTPVNTYTMLGSSDDQSNIIGDEMSDSSNFDLGGSYDLSGGGDGSSFFA